MSGGELFEKVAADNFELTEAEVVVFMREITEGARYIHQQVSVANFYKNSLCEPLMPWLGNRPSGPEAGERGVLRGGLLEGQNNRLRPRQEDHAGNEC